jgi:hypothetical protein
MAIFKKKLPHRYRYYRYRKLKVSAALLLCGTKKK